MPWRIRCAIDQRHSPQLAAKFFRLAKGVLMIGTAPPPAREFARVGIGYRAYGQPHDPIDRFELYGLNIRFRLIA
ncbi:hypothetical protein U1739_05090 [Sphingomonas sp. PB4P5]